MKISIVTPSFNQGPFLERTIQSVLEQRGDFELEYIIFDGGSTDTTPEILRRHEGRLFYKIEPDKGQVDAINKGFQRATGDIVGWLNSDDVLQPGALSRVADAFKADAQLQWVHGRCDIIDENDRVIRKWISAYKNWCCRRYSYSRLVTVNFISQMTVFWRRGLFERVGYLDPNLKLAFDYDFWLRLGKVGDPRYLRERQAGFRWYRTSKSGANYSAQFSEDYRVAQKHAPAERMTLFFKRMQTWRIVTVYKLMALLR